MKIYDLPDEVREIVLDRYRFINVEDIEWWEYSLDEIKEIGKILGIDAKNIYFSGFSSQGDGACFEGDYEYGKQACEKLRKFGRTDAELVRIARDLQKLQSKYFYQLSAIVTHRFHHYHENSVIIDVEINSDFSNEVTDEAEDGIEELLKDFMRWIYKELQDEYESLTSDEYVTETLELNEYSFTSEGEDM